MLDLRRCPKTCALLHSQGVHFHHGTISLSGAWVELVVPYVRCRRAEHRERQENLKLLSQRPDSTLFLGRVLLTDSWRHVRAEAVRGLLQQKTPLADALVTLALLDRSNLVVREVDANLTAVSVPVLVALLEDRIAPETLLSALQRLAQRQPTLALRLSLPRLEKEARRFFVLPAYRRQLRETIAVIETTTAHLKDLPLTAQEHTSAPNLPVPAEGAPLETTVLPWWHRWFRRSG